MATEQTVLETLRGLKDPDSQKDIVTLGLVRDLTIRGGEVSLTLAFSGQPPATKVMLHSMASRLVGQLPGVAKVNVKMGESSFVRVLAEAGGRFYTASKEVKVTIGGCGG